MKKILIQNIPPGSNNMTISLIIEAVFPDCLVEGMQDVGPNACIFTFKDPMSVSLAEFDQKLKAGKHKKAENLTFAEVSEENQDAALESPFEADEFEEKSSIDKFYNKLPCAAASNTRASFASREMPPPLMSQQPRGGRGGRGGKGRGRGSFLSQERGSNPTGERSDTFCLTPQRVKFLRSILKSNKKLLPGSVIYKDRSGEVVVNGNPDELEERRGIVTGAIQNMSSASDVPISLEFAKYLSVNPGSLQILKYCQEKRLFCRLIIEDDEVILLGRGPRDCNELFECLSADYVEERIEAESESGKGLTTFLKYLMTTHPLTFIREKNGVFIIESLDSESAKQCIEEIKGKVHTKEFIATGSKDIDVNINQFKILDLHKEKLHSAVVASCGSDFKILLCDKTVVRVEGPSDKLQEAECAVKDFIRDVVHETYKFKKAGIGENLFEDGIGRIHCEHLEVKHKCIIEACSSKKSASKVQLQSDPESKPAKFELGFLAKKEPSYQPAPSQAVIPKATKQLANLKVIQGDLTTCKAKVLAVPVVGDNSDPMKCGAICKSFAQKAGQDFCQRFSSVELELGAVESFQCDHRLILCFRIGKWHRRHSADLLMKCVAAAQKNGGSIAFPTVGCGGLKYPVQEVAEAFMKTAEKYSDVDVTVLAFDSKMHSEFASYLSPANSRIMRRSASFPRYLNELPAFKMLWPFLCQSCVKIGSHVDCSVEQAGVVRKAVRNEPKKPIVNCVEKEIEIHVWALGKDVAADVITKIKEMINRELYASQELPIDAGISEKCSDELLALQSRRVKVTIDPQQHKVRLAGCKDAVSQLTMQAHKLIIEDEADQRLPMPKESFEDIQRQKHTMDQTSYLHLLSEAEVLIPSYWKNNAKEPLVRILREKPETKIVEIQLEGRSGQAIAALVSSTWKSQLVGHGRDAANLGNYSRLHITKIERIENPKLWKSYTAKRADLLLKATKERPSQQSVITDDQKLDKDIFTDINEVFLFHGLKKDFLNGVQNQGVDPRLSGDRVLFGAGSYFAESTSKADQYTDDRQTRSAPGQPLAMLLCRVLLGSAFECRDPKPFKRPPCTTCQDDRCTKHDKFYDSIIGISKGPTGPALLFKEFVIYDRAQSYPEYIIHYVRQSSSLPVASVGHHRNHAPTTQSQSTSQQPLPRNMTPLKPTKVQFMSQMLNQSPAVAPTQKPRPRVQQHALINPEELRRSARCRQAPERLNYDRMGGRASTQSPEYSSRQIQKSTQKITEMHPVGLRRSARCRQAPERLNYDRMGGRASTQSPEYSSRQIQKSTQKITEMHPVGVRRSARCRQAPERLNYDIMGGS
ncbi:hypothetical protein CAPTEDRAFT_224773 [Capitella teleta]|uniref:Poly [ADP-ribose] polymerase n=1 Tax=Capitella teleta TaxID=283909 RepID=R7V3G0_CAPTE|nr:hypothetical protein CAPTEDRAFT_224773 [Capitella teleta]|eukprot:ELU10335.1 hypothetical protein CAPTEDRAFT_224773 [Capitella teleta]